MESISETLSGAVETLQEWGAAFVALLPNIVLAIVVALLTGFVARKASKWAVKSLQKRMDNQAAAGLLGRIAGMAIALGGLFTILSLLHLDKAVTSILAGVGVAGVAIGFALQETASNFIAGLIMAVRRPFAIGDAIRITGFEGVVQEIQLRYTNMRTYDGLIVSIPNRDVIKNPVVNITSTAERRVDVEIGIGYGDDLEKARKVFCDAMMNLERRDPSRDPQVIFTGFGDSSINAEVRVWLGKAETPNFLEARSEAIIALKKACDENGLSIPFPIRTLDFGANSVGGEALEDMEMQLRAAS